MQSTGRLQYFSACRVVIAWKYALISSGVVATFGLAVPKNSASGAKRFTIPCTSASFEGFYKLFDDCVRVFFRTGNRRNWHDQDQRNGEQQFFH